jgi:ankyrin repeat protein
MGVAVNTAKGGIPTLISQDPLGRGKKVQITEVWSSDGWVNNSDITMEFNNYKSHKWNMIDTQYYVTNASLVNASEKGLTESVRSLLDNGADPNMEDQNGQLGRTSLLLASRHGYADIVRLLLAAHVDIEDGGQSLCAASGKGHIDVVRLLLEHNANPNTAYIDKTPLMYAALNGRTDIVRLLLDHRADPTIKMENGTTALDLAYVRNHRDIVYLLRQAKGRWAVATGMLYNLCKGGVCGRPPRPLVPTRKSCRTNRSSTRTKRSSTRRKR